MYHSLRTTDEETISVPNFTPVTLPERSTKRATLNQKI